MTASRTDGWCAPSELIYLDAPVEIRPEVWPRGLTAEDIDWIVRMIHAAEIHVYDSDYLDLPSLSIRRGGVRWQ